MASNRPPISFGHQKVCATFFHTIKTNYPQSEVRYIEGRQVYLNLDPIVGDIDSDTQTVFQHRRPLVRKTKEHKMNAAQLNAHFSSVTAQQAALRAKYEQPPPSTISAGAGASPGFFDPLLRWLPFEGFWGNFFAVFMTGYVVWRFMASAYQRFEDLYQARLTRRDGNDQAQYFYSRTDFFFEALGEIVRFFIWTLPTTILGNAWPIILNLLYWIFWPVRIVWHMALFPLNLAHASYDAWWGTASYFRVLGWLQYFTSFAFWKYVISAGFVFYAIAFAYKATFPDSSTSQFGAPSHRPFEGSSSHYGDSRPSPTNDPYRYCYRTSESSYDCYREPHHELDRSLWGQETTETATMTKTKGQEWVHQHCTVGDPDRLTCYSTRITGPTPGAVDDAVRESGDAVPYSPGDTFATEEPMAEPTKNGFGEYSSEAPVGSPDLLKSPSVSSQESAHHGSGRVVRENPSQSSVITGPPLTSIRDALASPSLENTRDTVLVSDETLLVENGQTATITASTSLHIPGREERISSMKAENSAAAATKNTQYHDVIDDAKDKIFSSPNDAVVSAVPGKANQMVQKVREVVDSGASSCRGVYGSAKKDAKGAYDSCGEALGALPSNLRDAYDSSTSVVADVVSPPLIGGYAAAAKGGNFASKRWVRLQSWLKGFKTESPSHGASGAISSSSTSESGSIEHTEYTSVGAPSSTSTTPRTSSIHDETSASHASTHHSFDNEEFAHDAGATTSDGGHGAAHDYSVDDTEDAGLDDDLDANGLDGEESSHTFVEVEEAYDEASSRTTNDASAPAPGDEAHLVNDKSTSSKSHETPDKTSGEPARSSVGQTHEFDPSEDPTPEESDDQHRLPPLVADLNDTHEVHFDLKASPEDYEKLAKKIAEDGEGASWKFELEGHGTRTAVTASEAAQTQSTPEDDTWVELEVEEDEENVTATTTKGEETGTASECSQTVGKTTVAAGAESTPANVNGVRTKGGHKYCRTCGQPHGEPTK